MLNTSHFAMEDPDPEDNEEEEEGDLDTSTESLPLEVQIQVKDTESTSIYICEVCQKDKRDYNTLGDHRKHVHKLPWRQERLGPYVSLPSSIHNIHHAYFFCREKSHPMIYTLKDNW